MCTGRVISSYSHSSSSCWPWGGGDPFNCRGRHSQSLCEKFFLKFSKSEGEVSGVWAPKIMWISFKVSLFSIKFLLCVTIPPPKLGNDTLLGMWKHKEEFSYWNLTNSSDIHGYYFSLNFRNVCFKDFFIASLKRRNDSRHWKLSVFIKACHYCFKMLSAESH